MDIFKEKFGDLRAELHKGESADLNVVDKICFEMLSKDESRFMSEVYNYYAGYVNNSLRKVLWYRVENERRGFLYEGSNFEKVQVDYEDISSFANFVSAHNSFFQQTTDFTVARRNTKDLKSDNKKLARVLTEFSESEFCERIKVFSAPNCYMDHWVVNIFCEDGGNWSCLESLNLDNNNINDEVVSCFEYWMDNGRLSSLRRLSLHDNMIGDETVGLMYRGSALDQLEFMDITEGSEITKSELSECIMECEEGSLLSNEIYSEYKDYGYYDNFYDDQDYY